MKHTSIRWAERSLALVQQVAAEEGYTTSEFVREAALVRAAYILGKRAGDSPAELDELDELDRALREVFSE